MKIQVDAAAAAAVVKSLKPYTERGTLAVLQHVLIDAGESIRMTANNLEVSLECFCPGEVLAPGKVLARADVLLGLLARAPEASVTIDIDESGGWMKAGKRGRWKLPSMHNAAEFPEPSVIAAPPMILDSVTLRAALLATLPACAAKDPRGWCSGVALEFDGRRLTAAGTDGRRLHMIEFADALQVAREHPLSLILPRDAATNMVRTLPASGDLTLIAETGGIEVGAANAFRLNARALASRFPAGYRKVVPELSDAFVCVAAADLIAACERALVGQTDLVQGYRKVTICIVDDELRVSAGGDAESSDNLSIAELGASGIAEWQGAPDLLMDAIRVMDVEIIRLQAMLPQGASGGYAGTLRVDAPEKPGRVAVVMGMR